MDQKQSDLYEDLDTLAEIVGSVMVADTSVFIRVLEALSDTPFTDDSGFARQTVRRWLRDQARPLDRGIPSGRPLDRGIPSGLPSTPKRTQYRDAVTGETWFE